MMAPHEDQGFESMLAQLDARGCRVTRAERQSSASHPRQPLVNAEEVGASPMATNDVRTSSANHMFTRTPTVNDEQDAHDGPDRHRTATAGGWKSSV